MEPLKSKNMEGFAKDYVLHGNASKAYRENYKCGRMKDSSVHQNASKLLKHTKVAPRVAELQKIKTDLAEAEFSVTARSVLHRLVEIDEMDLADILNDDLSLKPLSDWPQVWRRTLSSIDIKENWTGSGEERDLVILKKIKWPDKLKNIELLGKHVEVLAFAEQRRIEGTVEHNHEHGGLPETARWLDALIGEGASNSLKKPMSH